MVQRFEGKTFLCGPGLMFCSVKSPEQSYQGLHYFSISPLLFKTLKAPILTAADNEFCDRFPHFRKK